MCGIDYNFALSEPSLMLSKERYRLVDYALSGLRPD
jgi:hypothetical protein